MCVNPGLYMSVNIIPNIHMLEHEGCRQVRPRPPANIFYLNTKYQNWVLHIVI